MTDKVKRPRRRSSKPKPENHYKTLGLRANATPDAIKKRYIELVKQHPPETHPEQFQSIRRAYETLRDPAQRSEYDLFRKYGGQVEKVLEEAGEALEEERLDRAAELFRKALQMSPRNLSACLGVAHVSFLLDDERSFQEHFHLAGELAASDEERVAIIASKVKLLLQNDRAHEALGALDDVTQRYPEYAKRFDFAYVEAYIALGRKQEAWGLAEKAMPSAEELGPEHLGRFIDVLDVMSQLDKWNYWSKVQALFKKFLKTIDDAEEREMVAKALLFESVGYMEAAMFREAEALMQLAQYAAPQLSGIRAALAEVKEAAKLQAEVERLTADPESFPLLSIYAFEWFQEEFVDPEDHEEIRDELPSSLFDEMLMMKEEQAAGVLRLKKRYPVVYKRYQDDWDEIYEEAVAGLNREARRRLR